MNSTPIQMMLEDHLKEDNILLLVMTCGEVRGLFRSTQAALPYVSLLQLEGERWGIFKDSQ